MEKSKIDFELWVVRGPYWCLPIHAVPCDTVYRIHAAVPLLNIQTSALRKQLLDHGAIENEEELYMEPERLCKTAKPVTWTFETEEHLVDWRVRSKERVKVAHWQEDQEFYDALAMATGEKTATEAKARWQLTCRHIAHWLANRKRPIHFGFVSLYPVPVRPNWKTLVLQRVVQWWKAREGMVAPVKWVPGNLEKFIEDPRLFCVSRKSKLLLWHVDVVHHRKWWEITLKVERETRRRLRGGYWVNVIRLFKAMSDQLKYVYTKFSKEADHPFPVISKSVWDSSGIPRKGRGPRQLGGEVQNLPNPKSHVYQPCVGEIRREPGVRLSVEDEDALMSQVPDLCAGKTIVRKTRGDDDRPEDGEGNS